MDSKKIKITRSTLIKTDLNLACEKYINFLSEKMPDISDLLVAIKAMADAISQVVLHHLELNNIQIYNTSNTGEVKRYKDNNTRTITFDESVKKLKRINIFLSFESDIDKLKGIRNKLVHNEDVIHIEAACKLIDNAMYSLGKLIKPFRNDLFQCLTKEHLEFLKDRLHKYQRQAEDNSCVVTRENYNSIAQFETCPFCSEEGAFYLDSDQEYFKCAFCHVEEKSLHCSECLMIYPESLAMSFCEDEALCDDCYKFYEDRFNS